eukprot:TRINITY_DN2639_c0_g2_i1.p1 TRINITY_DN2639_c0_g2~~TRINITY_DN2639_c0_g2_i1.p1  ORF type:complete len:538 (+),score=170.92 TRINITY_DN2639_c0_g2_i1:93-1706(+)
MSDRGKKLDSRRKTKAKRKNRLQHNKLKTAKPRKDFKEVREEIRPEDLVTYTREEKLEALSATAAAILQSPETSLKLLKDLFVLLEDDDPALIVETLKKLCDVFLDILPTYKIRVDDSKKEEVKLSKEVQQLRDYDTSLLENYAKYLRISQAFLKTKLKKVKGEENKAKFALIKETAFDCFCRMVENIPYMNYMKPIVLLVVSKLASRSAAMRQRSMEAIKDLFSNLEHSANMLDLKLQAVKAIGKLVKSKSHKSFDRKMLVLFQEHQLVIPKGEAQAKSNAKVEELRLAIKKKKGRKEVRELQRILLKELKEASSMTANLSQIRRYNTEILREVLAIYLSILKDNPKSPLMVSVFEGFPHIAPHIDIELVSDCLSVIKSYIKEAFTQKDIDLLNIAGGIRCALRISQTLGSTFDVDERSFFAYLFKFLDYFLDDSLDGEVFDSVMKSLRSLFVDRRQFSLDVLAAFCKKLAVIALSIGVERCVEILELMCEIFKKYTRIRGLLEEDESTVEPKVVVKEIIDPVSYTHLTLPTTPYV